jgi:hypothetical protein
VRKPSYIARELWDKPSPSIMRGVKKRIRTNNNTERLMQIMILIEKTAPLCVLGVSDTAAAESVLKGNLPSDSHDTAAERINVGHRVAMDLPRRNRSRSLERMTLANAPGGPFGCASGTWEYSRGGCPV